MGCVVNLKPTLFRMICLAGVTISVSFLDHSPSEALASQNQPPSGQTTTDDKTSAFAKEIPSALVQLGVASNYYSPYAFVVDKKARTLSVWTQEAGGFRMVTQFAADLGKRDGDKVARGDHRTPEGVYFMLEKLEGAGLDFSQYGKLAFTTDYPNFFDRRDGKTGDGIWLHAIPDEVPLTRGSRGCVVVRNDAILSLKPYVRVEKTPILIESAVEMVSVEGQRKKASELLQMIEAWRTSWQDKNIDQYMSHYGESFRSMNMNRDQWRKFKSGLNEKYQQIAVQFSQPKILRFRNRYVVRFLQDYRSDQHTDFGEKTLYIERIDRAEGGQLTKAEGGQLTKAEGGQLTKAEGGQLTGSFKIVGEEWKADPTPAARDEFNSARLALSSSAIRSQTEKN